MKKIIKYECGICGRRFDNMGDAFACEAEGLAREYPIGCIFACHTAGAMYSNMTFAVASNRLEKHLNWRTRWACRDNQYDDCLGENKCGSDINDLNEYDARIDFNHPTFIRMVEWLKSQSIPITIWNGVEAVPYDETIHY